MEMIKNSLQHLLTVFEKDSITGWKLIVKKNYYINLL
jgi:hypothetical protein